jgi:hypothetical protein
MASLERRQLKDQRVQPVPAVPVVPFLQLCAAEINQNPMFEDKIFKILAGFVAGAMKHGGLALSAALAPNNNPALMAAILDADNRGQAIWCGMLHRDWTRFCALVASELGAARPANSGTAAEGAFFAACDRLEVLKRTSAPAQATWESGVKRRAAAKRQFDAANKKAGIVPVISAPLSTADADPARLLENLSTRLGATEETLVAAALAACPNIAAEFVPTASDASSAQGPATAAAAETAASVTPAPRAGAKTPTPANDSAHHSFFDKLHLQSCAVLHPGTTTPNEFLLRLLWEFLPGDMGFDARERFLAALVKRVA